MDRLNLHVFMSCHTGGAAERSEEDNDLHTGMDRLILHVKYCVTQEKQSVKLEEQERKMENQAAEISALKKNQEDHKKMMISVQVWID